MRKALVSYIVFATSVISILFSPHSVQVVNAQNNDQLFKDCRSKILGLGNRMSEVADRAPYEDVRTEAQAIMTELLVVQSDCEPVKDRLAQDPALQFQNEYFMERAKESGLTQ